MIEVQQSDGRNTHPRNQYCANKIFLNLIIGIHKRTQEKVHVILMG